MRKRLFTLFVCISLLLSLFGFSASAKVVDTTTIKINPLTCNVTSGWFNSTISGRYTFAETGISTGNYNNASWNYTSFEPSYQISYTIKSKAKSLYKFTEGHKYELSFDLHSWSSAMENWCFIAGYNAYLQSTEDKAISATRVYSSLNGNYHNNSVNFTFSFSGNQIDVLDELIIVCEYDKTYVKNNNIKYWNIAVENCVVRDLGSTSLFGGIADIGGWFNDLINNVSSFFSTLTGNISGFFTTLGNKISAVPTTLWNNIQTLPSTIWENTKTLPSTIWNNVKTLPATIWTNVKTIPGLVWGYVKDIPANVWEFFKDIPSKITGLPATIWGFFSGIPDKIAGVAKSILDGIFNFFLPDLEFIKNHFQSIADWCDQHFGFLFYPFKIVLDFCNRLLTINPLKNPTIAFPAIVIMGYTIIPKMTYTLGSFSIPEIANLYTLYQTVVCAIIAFWIIKLASRKVNEILKAGNAE